MNSNYGKSNQQKGSLNNFNFDFDLGIGSNQPKSLNAQKNPTSSSNSYFTSSSQPKPSWQPGKPSWTHQPSPNLAAQPGLPGGPVSMVGDIFGKTWGSSQPSAPISTINKDPNLFGDLVGSALGQGPKGSTNTNVPLKNATPTSNKASFSMGNMADSLPKTNNNGSWGYSGNSAVNSSNKSTNLGGPSMSGVNVGMSSSKDPFSSLSGFGSKQSGSLNSASKVKVNDRGDDGFGSFQGVSNKSSTTFPSSGSTASGVNFSGSVPLSQKPVQTSGSDPLDMLFSSSSATFGVAGVASEGFGGQASSEVDDWGMDSGFGGGDHDVGGTTTELEGLPPPPPGVSGSAAKSKGLDNYKQGQYADAIKWLSWATILLEKSGDEAGNTEVLSCRASCYKEVGEYKKAVADCTKVLENDDTNVTVLVQRALLYESMEKYRLGADDLRTVLKIDPSNRVARSTIHRLNKMAD